MCPPVCGPCAALRPCSRTARFWRCPAPARRVTRIAASAGRREARGSAIVANARASIVEMQSSVNAGGADKLMTEGAIIQLPQWLRSPVGQVLLEWEQRHLDRAVADLFGFHALQLGLPQLDALQANRMPHRWLAVESAGEAEVSDTDVSAATSVSSEADPTQATPRVYV